MKRKLLSLILVAAMLASMLVFAPTSGAATNTTANVAVTDATAKAGGTVSVDVIVTSEKLQSFDLGFKYDTTKLELVTHAQGGADLPAKVLGDFATDAVLSKNSTMGLVGVSSGVAVAVDASAGVTIATITFNVKAGATPGDTYVEFVSTNGLFVNPTDDVADRITGDNLTNKAGKITILPAGYAEDNATVLDGFVEGTNYFDLSIAGLATEAGTGWVIFNYPGGAASGDVVIPSEFGGLPVKAIWSDAFKGFNFSSIEIPASVTSVGATAFANSTAASVSVLNPDCVIGDHALGYTVTSNPFTGTSYAKVAGFTIYGYAGSTAEAYATANGFTFVEYAPAPTLTYTVGGDTYTYVVGNSTTAPGSAVVNGEVIVAWNDGVNNIAPGASMTIAGATTLAPVTIKAPATQNGADVKVGATADDFALRFTSKLAISDYEKLGEIGKVQLGMLITPQKYVDYATAFTKADLAAWVVSQRYQAKDAYVDVQVNSYLSMDDNDYTIAASLKGFSDATRAKNPTFAAIAYAEITIGENVVTVYGSYDKACGRDAKTVLQALSNAGTLGTTQQGWLTALIGKFY